MFKRNIAIILILSLFPFLSGCFGAAPIGMLSLAPGVYFAIPGNLRIEPEKEDPFTEIGKKTRVRTVAVNGEDFYDAIDQSGIFEEVDFYSIIAPHSRREAGQYAKDNGLDAFLIVDKNMEARIGVFDSSHIGGLKAKIVDTDGKVLYDQVILAKKKQGMWGNLSGEEVDKSSIQGLLNDLEKHFM